MAIYKAFKMNTGDEGEHVYHIMFWDGMGWVSSRPTKYFKTLKGAEKEIKKRMQR